MQDTAQEGSESLANMNYKSGYCAACNADRKVERKGVNHILHLILTIITIGFWSIIWIGVGVKFGGWRCSECGSTKVSKVR